MCFLYKPSLYCSLEGVEASLNELGDVDVVLLEHGGNSVALVTAEVVLVGGGHGLELLV